MKNIYYHLQFIEETKETLSKLDGKSHLSKDDVIRNPGEVIETLQSASRSVQEMNLALEEIEETGFKVNSLITYKQVRDIDEKIAKLSGGGLFSDFAR